MKNLSAISILCTCFFFFLITPGQLKAQGSEPEQLEASNINENQDYGYNVDLSGDVAVVGAFRDNESPIIEKGAAYVYRYSGASWVEEARLEASDIDNFDWFGWDVGISGDVIVVSAREGDALADNAGDVTVFRKNGAAWNEETILVPTDGDPQTDFGFAVDIDGDVIAVGGPGKSDSQIGQGIVYVYRYNGSQWVDDGTLVASDAGSQDLFGSAISIDGNRILVGSFNADDSTSNQAGKLYVYEYIERHWFERGILQASDSNNIANLGVSVALENDWAVGGAPLNRELSGGAGAVYVYRREGGGIWNFHSKLTASDGAGFFLFGSSVSISGNKMVVGADNWAAPGAGGTGKAYLFEYDAITDTWEETAGFVPANATQGSAFGHAAAMEGEVMLIGAPEYSGAEGNMGTAYIYGAPQVVTSNEQELPQEMFTISGPYPNPFGDRARLNVTSVATLPARIAMFDMLGREIRTVFEGQLQAGVPTQIQIEAGDLAGGVYWVKVMTSTAVVPKALTLAR